MPHSFCSHIVIALPNLQTTYSPRLHNLAVPRLGLNLTRSHVLHMLRLAPILLDQVPPDRFTRTSLDSDFRLLERRALGFWTQPDEQHHPGYHTAYEYTLHGSVVGRIGAGKLDILATTRFDLGSSGRDHVAELVRYTGERGAECGRGDL